MSSAPPPCDWQTTRKVIKERGQYLLESGIWSDCHFVVGTEPNQQTIAGHKLFLAMSSPVFEAMFFGGMPEKDPIAILDVQPEAFKALLEYIYTDAINLTSFDQACELCYAGKKYMLPHLVEECTKYLWSDLYPKNACRAYEFAKLFEEPTLMEKCIGMICNDTQEVLQASSFEDVEITTILLVVDQDELNINSELELFSAINRYAVKRNQTAAQVDANPNNSYPTIRDIIKKLRFLTLTPQQFADGPGKSNLLTETEKFAILMNICTTNSTMPMPEGFSTSKTTRRRKQQSDPVCVPLMALMEGGNDSSKKMYCTRQILHTTDCMNLSVLDCSLTFSCDKNVCVYGIQIPSQIPLGDDWSVPDFYPELLYAHLLDSEGSRLTYTHFTSRVSYRSVIEITFNRPWYIQRHKVYRVGVVLNKIGCYPRAVYPTQTAFCNGVMFTFNQNQSGESRDGLIRSIIFSIPSSNNNSNVPLNGSGDHKAGSLS